MSLPSDGKPLEAVGIVFEGVDESNIDEIKHLNTVLFPIRYTDQTYGHILACGDVSVAARSAGQVIGAITGRLENTPQGVRFYIITLGVYAPYRRQGIASELIRRSLAVLAECVPECTGVGLHVHTANEEALAFYMSHGFVKSQLMEGYYRQLDPPDAWLLIREPSVSRASGTEGVVEAGDGGEADTAGGGRDGASDPRTSAGLEVIDLTEEGELPPVPTAHPPPPPTRAITQ